MVYTNKTLNQMLGEIGNHKLVRFDRLDSTKSPEAFCDFHLKEGGLVKVPNTKYMLSLHRLMGLNPALVLNEIFFNITEYAHKGKNLPINLYIFKGQNGFVISVEDSGKGFDYQKLIEKKRNGKKYYHRGGSGLKRLDYSGMDTYDTSIEGKGTIVNVHFKKRK